jgi:hypothetical protein
VTPDQIARMGPTELRAALEREHGALCRWAPSLAAIKPGEYRAGRFTATKRRAMARDFGNVCAEMIRRGYHTEASLAVKIEHRLAQRAMGGDA